MKDIFDNCNDFLFKDLIDKTYQTKFIKRYDFIPITIDSNNPIEKHIQVLLDNFGDIIEYGPTIKDESQEDKEMYITIQGVYDTIQKRLRLYPMFLTKTEELTKEQKEYLISNFEPLMNFLYENYQDKNISGIENYL